MRQREEPHYATCQALAGASRRRDGTNSLAERVEHLFCDGSIPPARCSEAKVPYLISAHMTGYGCWHPSSKKQTSRISAFDLNLQDRAVNRCHTLVQSIFDRLGSLCCLHDNLIDVRAGTLDSRRQTPSRRSEISSRVYRRCTLVCPYSAAEPVEITSVVRACAQAGHKPIPYKHSRTLRPFLQAISIEAHIVVVSVHPHLFSCIPLRLVLLDIDFAC